MTYIVGLVLLLIILAGVIAYAGDRLGAWVGRKRLSLFGARPRVTGQIVGMLAGVAIMLTTLLVLSAAFENATATLLNAQRTAQELSSLQAERRELVAHVEDLQAQIERGQGELASAREQLEGMQEELGSTQERLQSAMVRLEQAQALQEQRERDAAAARDDAQAARLEAQTLREQIEELEGEMAVIQSELDERNRLLEEQDQLLSEIEQQIGALEGEAQALRDQNEQLRSQNQNLVNVNASLEQRAEDLGSRNSQLEMRNLDLVQINQQLLEDVRASNQRVDELQGNLWSLQAELEERSRRLAEIQTELSVASDGELSFRRGEVIYSGLLEAQTLEQARSAVAALVREASSASTRRGAGEISLRAEQFDSLVSLLGETGEELLVVFISPRNQFRTAAQVEVQVEAYENGQLFEAGQLITSGTVHVGSPALRASQSDLRTEILELVRETESRLTMAGLFSPEPIDFRVSEDALVRQLLQMSGEVTVGVMAAQPVLRSGPAVLELLILR